MKKNSNKGFTLAELLIVVAIIAVLVAISIPVFTAQLEKAREATDAANLRSAYAVGMAEALSNDATTWPADYASVEQKQTVAGWATNPDFPVNMSVDAPKASGTWTLDYTKDTNGLVTGAKATN